MKLVSSVSLESIGSLFEKLTVGEALYGEARAQLLTEGRLPNEDALRSVATKMTILLLEMKQSIASVRRGVSGRLSSEHLATITSVVGR
jgi:hypothetical protein